MGNDHCPEASLGSKSGDEQCEDCSKSTEAEDCKYGVANKILFGQAESRC